MGSPVGRFEVSDVQYNKKHVPPMTFFVGKLISGTPEAGDWIVIPGYGQAEKIWSIENHEEVTILAFRGIIEPDLKTPFEIALTGKW